MHRGFRAILACAVMIVVGMIGGTGTARGQITCLCHLVQIHVDSNLTCNVQVCISGVATPECKIVAPGTDTVISCPDGGYVVIVDGCGIRHRVPVGGCLFNLPGPAPCCVDACIRTDENGCLHLVLSKGTAGHCFCPGG